MAYVNEEDRKCGVIIEDLKNAIQARSLSVLMLGAVHNLKSPITAIMMNLELLSDSIVSADPETDDVDAQLRYLTVIKSELERLNGLVGGLYKQTFNNEVEQSECDLGQIIDDLSYLLRPQASSQKVAIKFSKPGMPITLTCIQGDLKQAILNILLNALEIMPEGGIISISLDQDNEKICLKIGDTGPGIPENIKDKLFDLHFSTKTTGTGIGLYVSRYLIEKHGGQIEVSSKEGRGACFEISFELKQKEELKKA